MHLHLADEGFGPSVAVCPSVRVDTVREWLSGCDSVLTIELLSPRERASFKQHGQTADPAFMALSSSLNTHLYHLEFDRFLFDLTGI